jgi:hypothetical protein
MEFLLCGGYSGEEGGMSIRESGEKGKKRAKIGVAEREGEG